MSLLVLTLIGVTIVVSSFLSGVFGLAGGMVLLGVLLLFLDVTAGMVLSSSSPTLGARCSGGVSCAREFSGSIAWAER